MRLIELELTNCCQHRHLHWKFKPGVVGIFGPNGSGKSNAMTMAYAILTNDFSRLAGGKEKVLCQQAEPGEYARGRLVAEHAGTRFEITRTVLSDGSGKHRLVIGDKEIKKAQAIQAELEDVLGLRRRLIDDYLFVQQGKLYEFLSLQPAVRAKSFAHLCNTTHAETCWDLIGKQIDVDRALAVNVVDNSDEIRQQIGEYQQKVRENKAKLTEAEALLLDDSDKEKYERRVRRNERCRELQTDLPDMLQAAKRKKQLRLSSLRSWQRYRDSYDVLSSEAEEISERATKAGRQLAVYDAQKSAWDNKQSILTRLAAKEAEVRAQTEACPARPDTELSLEELQEQQRQLRNKYDTAKTLVESLTGKDVAACPTCGTPVKTLQGRIKQAKVDMEEVPATLSMIRGQIRDWQTYEREIQDHRVKLGSLGTAVSTLQGSLVAVKDVEEPAAAPKSLQQAIDTESAHKLATKTAKQNLDKAATALAAAIAEHKSAVREYKTTKEKIAKLHVSAKLLATAKRYLQRHREAELAIAGLQATLQSHEEVIAAKTKELDRLARMLERSKTARDWIDLLEQMRTVLHRDNLPRVVHHNALLRMEDEINDGMEFFENPFRVTVEPNLGFMAHFPQGTVWPAEGLSGGQSGVLAISFRFAVNSLFAGSIGMMVLDEPTAGLDEDNLQYLQAALVHLRRFAKSRGFQVIIITHEQCLKPVFDQVIQL